MSHLDFLPVCQRMQAALPRGGADAQVAMLQVKQVQGIARPAASTLVETRRKLRIEIDIRPLHGAVVLAEMHQRNIRVDVLGIQGFSPARVRQDHVRAIASAAQLQQQPGYLLTMQDGILDGIQIVVDLRGNRPAGAVAQRTYPRHTPCRITGNSQQLAATVLEQTVCQVEELAGKVLVDEQQFHDNTCSMSPARRASMDRLRWSRAGPTSALVG